MEKPICYISMSLQCSLSRRNEVTDLLRKQGLYVTYYNRGEPYTDTLLMQSDFVLLISHGLPKFRLNTGSRKVYNTLVGKGCHEEVWNTLERGKDVFVFHGVDEDDNILVSKVEENPEKAFVLSPQQDWKRDYSYVYSYVRGQGPISLIPFLHGSIPGYYEQVKHLVEETLQKASKKLLLLLRH